MKKRGRMPATREEGSECRRQELLIAVIDSTKTGAGQNSKKTQQPSKQREYCLEGTTRDKRFVVVSEV